MHPQTGSGNVYVMSHQQDYLILMTSFIGMGLRRWSPHTCHWTTATGIHRPLVPIRPAWPFSSYLLTVDDDRIRQQLSLSFSAPADGTAFPYPIHTPPWSCLPSCSDQRVIFPLRGLSLLGADSLLCPPHVIYIYILAARRATANDWYCSWCPMFSPENIVALRVVI